MRNVLELSSTEARDFFLKEESYYNFDLPNYFKFQSLIDKVDKKIGSKPLSNFYRGYTDPVSGKPKTKYPSNFENVNYKFLNNKDGKFAWRPLQLIHPAIYVSLVRSLTKEKNWNLILERFNEFQKNPNIKCFSLPILSEADISDKAATIKNWWEKIEQKSLELALECEYSIHTDITDCYGSIYTHSIAWALHDKTTAKKQRDDRSLLGNIIDRHLQDMSYGQTNGIPQGSTLMDFIAEIILGYADLELASRLESLSIIDYQIIRYRDDYRIFSNNPQNAELILKHITEVLIGLNMKLNSQKTLISNDIIQDSIKPDKLFWNLSNRSSRSLQNHLLIIHDLARKYPNSGSLSRALDKYFTRIDKIDDIKANIKVLISILLDITFKNPRTYPISSAILSLLILFLETDEERDIILEKIQHRFNLIPNTGHLHIWLQRITITFDRDREYNEPLCKKVNDSSIEIWNSRWLNSELRNIINNEDIVSEKVIEELGTYIQQEEVKLFGSKSDYEYRE